jgi:hypothetical protein
VRSKSRRARPRSVRPNTVGGDDSSANRSRVTVRVTSTSPAQRSHGKVHARAAERRKRWGVGEYVKAHRWFKSSITAPDRLRQERRQLTNDSCRSNRHELSPARSARRQQRSRDVHRRPYDFAGSPQRHISARSRRDELGPLANARDPSPRFRVHAPRRRVPPQVSPRVGQGRRLRPVSVTSTACSRIRWRARTPCTAILTGSRTRRARGAAILARTIKVHVTRNQTRLTERTFGDLHIHRCRRAHSLRSAPIAAASRTPRHDRGTLVPSAARELVLDRAETSR